MKSPRTTCEWRRGLRDLLAFNDWRDDEDTAKETVK